jgi:hypothetical protein
MTALSRRSFLKQAPIAAVVAGTPITLAVAEARAVPVEDSDMRCMRLARELFNAMKDHYGDGCKMIRNEDNGAVFFLPPPPPPRIVAFAGPGWYEVESRGPELPTDEMWIEVSHKYPADPKHGRWFLARSRDARASGVCLYQESWLRKILIRKIGGAV